MGKYEIRISKLETNSNTLNLNDQNKNGITAALLFRILIIWVLRLFRISGFDIRILLIRFSKLSFVPYSKAVIFLIYPNRVIITLHPCQIQPNLPGRRDQVR